MRLTIILSVEDIMRNETIGLVDAIIDVKRAMTELTPKQRQALDLWLQGHTQQEIGERLGINQSSVCRRIQDAFAMLRMALG